MKAIFCLIISAALAVSGYSQTRNVLVGTNNAVVQPTNFWSADVTNARSGLGLGSSATNAASAFQPSSYILSNLVSGGALTFSNITIEITNVTGLQTALNGKLGTNPTLAISNINNLQTTLDGKLGTNPTLQISNISGLQTNLDSKLSPTGSAANLTNFPTVALASNITGTAALATNVTGVVDLANGGTSGTNANTARTSLGATTVGANLFTLINPDDTRFLRLNANNSVSSLSAVDMRTALSVGTNLGTVTSVGMTVPNIFSLSVPTITSSGTFALTLASQSSRQALLVPNGGGIPVFRGIESDDLPSFAISKITGLQTALDGKLSITGTAALATNVTGVVGLINGGTSGTNAATARTGIGATTVGANIFTLINPSAVRFLRVNADNTASALSDSEFRTAIGLDSASTNASSAFQPSSTVLSNLTSSNAINITNIRVTNIVGWSAITNINSSTSLLGFTTNGQVVSGTNVLTFSNDVKFGGGDLTVSGAVISGAGVSFSFEDGALSGPITLETNSSLAFQGVSAATTRTNLGLGWSALTNSNAGTGLVSVNTNGTVVSPTNFWQIAPIVTLFQDFTGIVTSQTNNATNTRNLYIYSLATNVAGISNTILLPTNSASLTGDEATIVHYGTTNTLTIVRQSGATNNLIVISNFDESIKFILESGQWGFYQNISYVEPIRFSGTNASNNIASTRANLNFSTNLISLWTATNASNARSAVDLGATWLTNTNVTNFRTAVGLGATNTVTFGQFNATSWISTPYIEANALFIPDGGGIEFEDGGTINFNNAAGSVRASLGLPLAALTNTNNATFQAAIFSTNSTPTNAANFGDYAAFLGVSIITNGVTNTFKIPLYK